MPCLAAGTIGPALAVPGPPALSTPTLTDPLPGATRLPNGWALHPAGTQVLTSRAPTGVTVAPDGTAYAVTSGILEEAVDRIDPATLVPTETLVGEAYQGVAADAGGDVWVSGGPANAVFQYRAVGPALVDARQAGAAPATPNKGIPVTGFPGNMLLDPPGHRLFVAGNLSVPSKVAQAAGAAPCVNSPICSVVNVIDVSDPSATSPAVRAISVGRDAYGLAYRAATGTLYVSNWADQTNRARGGTGTVSVVQPTSRAPGGEAQVVRVGSAPTGVALSPDGRTLAVANSDSDTVSLLPIATNGTVDTTAVNTVPVGLPGAPVGTMPMAVAYSADGRYLFVALAGLDAIEVLDASGGPARAAAISQTVSTTYRQAPFRVSAPTYIPTGWFPDALTLRPGTRTLYVANLRGNGAGPGYYGQVEPLLVGTATEGTLSVIDLPGDPRSQFRQWTQQVVQGDQLAPVFSSRARQIDPAFDPCAGAPSGGDVLCGGGKLDPRAVHVVQILAENKTFDAYFGDTLGRFQAVDANPSFTEYGAAVTTNQHDLASAYSLSDNFWNEGAEASDLGHSWITGGYTTPYSELTWGQNYDQGLRGGRVHGAYSGSSFAGHPIGTVLSDPAVAAEEQAMSNPRQLIADEAERDQLGVRVYSTDVNPGSPVSGAGDQLPPGDWGLGPTSPVDTDLAFPDTDRANIFLSGQTTSHAWDELQTRTPPSTFGKAWPPAPTGDRFTLAGWTKGYRACLKVSDDATCQRKMPNYIYMTLSENHTYDLSNVFNPVDPTPQSMVADNDYAIGLIVQSLSRSPFWKNTIVFVTEDDSQYTGDHVDIHRDFLLAVGGLASRLGPSGRLSHQPGSFPSVLKTTENLLGLQPMTLFDWLASPLHEMVAPGTPAPAPAYTAVKPPTPFLIGQS